MKTQPGSFHRSFHQSRHSSRLWTPPLLLASAALFLMGGCARTSFDAAAESQKLLQRDAEWADTAAAGKDVEKIVSYWSDDAVVIEPGQPVYEGKAAIRAYVTASLKTPGFKIHWVSEKPVFSPDGKMAWMRGVDVMTVPGPNGALMTLHQRGISIWRRDPDGVWRCVVDIANKPPAATVSISAWSPAKFAAHHTGFDVSRVQEDRDTADMLGFALWQTGDLDFQPNP